MDRIQDLNAMGIDVWVRRNRPELETLLSAPAEIAAQSSDLADEVRAETAPAQVQSTAPPDQAKTPPELASANPTAITPAVREDTRDATEIPMSPPPSVTTATPTQPQAGSADDRLGHKSLADLRQTVAMCTRCELHLSRTQTVFGVGDSNAQLLVIGEAPGAEEDRRGEPFVGPAGQLLNAMLRAIGIRRETAYIANILKCRPPNNRDPHKDEVAHCAQYLSAQVQLIAPRVILAVGRIAAQNLLGETTPIGKMRGRRYTYKDTEIPVIVTYHPAYLIRSPQEKSKAWQDLKLVRSLL